jgi:hypothetical protein
MWQRHSGAVALACTLALGPSARAQQAPAPKPAAPSAAAPLNSQPAASKPASPTSGSPTPASPKPGSPESAAPAASRPPATAVLSESKYLSLLYVEIAKHTPQDNATGPGEVAASFVVGPSGHVDKVTIDKTSSPAHAEIVKKILSEVATPPPPGGSIEVGQTFKFH